MGEHDRWTANTARERITDAVDELVLIWPHLTDALTADTGHTQDEKVHTSENPGHTPVNPDAFRAITTLSREIPATHRRLCTLIGEPYSGTRIETSLRQFPHIYDRLISTNALAAARRLAAAVGRWRCLAKLGTGLLQHDRPLRRYCPRHDQPFTELVALGDEAWLRQVGGELYIDWTHDGRVWCRHCGSTWTPRELLWLGRLLRDADRRRTQGAA